MLLRCETEAEVGETVLLSLKVPGGSTWIDAEARIARIVRGLRAQDQGPALGLAFQKMSPFDRAVLTGSLEGAPPPPPARGLRRDYAASVMALSLLH